MSNKLKKILLSVLLVAGCAQNNGKSSLDKINSDGIEVLANKSNLATIRVIERKNMFDASEIVSRFGRILDSNKNTIYKSSFWDLTSPKELEVAPGKYKIMFTCHTTVWNDNWMNIEPKAGGDYTIFCLTETRGQSFFGDKNIVALHPFFEKTSELNDKAEEYQAIIDAPPATMIESPILEGKTRLIVYYEAARFLGIENRNRYTLRLNGKYLDQIDPLKYSVTDVENGSYHFGISNPSLVKKSAELSFSANGQTIYIFCKENSVSAMQCDKSHEKPVSFDQLKPMRIFKY